MADKTAKSFIEQLMNKTPELRLGGSYTALKAHAWFKDFNWVFSVHLCPGSPSSQKVEDSCLATER
jgi:hypothetical protein